MTWVVGELVCDVNNMLISALGLLEMRSLSVIVKNVLRAREFVMHERTIRNRFMYYMDYE